MRPGPETSPEQQGYTMDILNSAFGIHEQALKVRSQRMDVLARNIANADTPNYKAQDLDFKAMLKEVKKDYLTATHDKRAGIERIT